MYRCLRAVSPLAIGCLLLAPAAQSCSSKNSSDGGSDSGTPDSGADAGQDAGVVINIHGLGMPCSDPDDLQANCSRGLVCAGISPLNACTVFGCFEAFDGGANPPPPGPCGLTETGLQNICLPFSSDPANSACARGCDPSVTTNPCDRSEFSCWTEEDSTETPCNTDSDCAGNMDYCAGGFCSIAFCWPDCRTMGNGCSYGSFCASSNGECNITACGRNGTCPTGQVCFTDTTNGNAMECVDDCRVDAGPASECPGNRTCNTTTGVCDPIINTSGELCGATIAECDTTSICITFSAAATAGECLGSCTPPPDAGPASDAGASDGGASDGGAASGSGCTGGSTCSVGLTNGSFVCTPPPCTVDGGSTCAAGEVCGSLQLTSTTTIEACVPSPDAG